MTYYVALPFVQHETGIRRGSLRNARTSHRQSGAPKLCPTTQPNVGALAFKRSGDPNLGNYGDATILKKFGDVPDNLDEL